MVKTVEQISIFLNNKPGNLYEILTYLDEKEINLLSLNISETDKYGIIRIIVEDAKKVLGLLKAKNYLASINEIFVVAVSHNFGSLKSLIEMIAKEGINIDYMYSMVVRQKSDTAYLAFATNNIPATAQLLSSHNISTL